ncbi:hypothetical protein NIES4071_85980 [Calothrix sp. NIES-4071]|nr:hypothetical protein NIES4071_85980 [Calothrix sp. NIES-4071]BAZ62865.1 hypothetical protein NIES4105_85910 [Calothrix sp. NIES-4105]
MKAYEFPAVVNAEGKIVLPDTVLQHLPQNQHLKVIIMFNEPSQEEIDDQAWHRLAAEQLLKGYSDSDAIYDTI